MKWLYDYENQKMIYADNSGYNYSENRLMEAGTYDSDDAEEDEFEHDHVFDKELLESDEEQAIMNGWIQNENYNNTYGIYNEDHHLNEYGEEQSWLNEHTHYDEDNDGVIDDWFSI